MNGRSDGNLAHAKGPVPSMNFHAGGISRYSRSYDPPNGKQWLIEYFDMG